MEAGISRAVSSVAQAVAVVPAPKVGIGRDVALRRFIPRCSSVRTAKVRDGVIAIAVRSKLRFVLSQEKEQRLDLLQAPIFLRTDTERKEIKRMRPSVGQAWERSTRCRLSLGTGLSKAGWTVPRRAGIRSEETGCDSR